jgi:hypothetical protein
VTQFTLKQTGVLPWIGCCTGLLAPCKLAPVWLQCLNAAPQLFNARAQCLNAAPQLLNAALQLLMRGRNVLMRQRNFLMQHRNSLMQPLNILDCDVTMLLQQRNSVSCQRNMPGLTAAHSSRLHQNWGYLVTIFQIGTVIWDPHRAILIIEETIRPCPLNRRLCCQR